MTNGWTICSPWEITLVINQRIIPPVCSQIPLSTMEHSCLMGLTPGSWEQRGPGNPDQGTAESYPSPSLSGQQVTSKGPLQKGVNYQPGELPQLKVSWVPHPREYAWIRHNLYWHNASHDFRHQQQKGQCGHLQQSIGQKDGQLKLPYGLQRTRTEYSFFLQLKVFKIKGEGGQRGFTGSIMAANGLFSLKCWCIFIDILRVHW